MSEEIQVGVFEINDDNKTALVSLALSMYVGEKCKYCLGEFDTLSSLKDAVYAGYHEHGRVAHKACWDANNLEVQS